MVSMRNAIDQKGVQIKNLEEQLSQASKNIEAAKQENFGMKKDLVWAKSYCSTMRLELESVKKQKACLPPVPSGRIFAQSNRHQDCQQVQQQQPQIHVTHQGSLQKGAPINNIVSFGIRQEQIKQDDSKPSSNCNTEKTETSFTFKKSSKSLASHFAQLSKACLETMPSAPAPRGLSLVRLSELQAPSR